ncbi:protease complex subunit PrcB family protein [Inediibacterium massiliense]|uniref:protease complex subunit PrcB family protein n=1 Tax=Inediibacterium massiliense TaxID=1658111 RepID=UPI0006B42243|nr:protease complex subunit PrcB family protein [Inediibacterium massiliense]
MKEKLKALNYKKIFIIAIVIMVIIGIFLGMKYFIGDDEEVSFEVLNQDQIPQKIQEILPRYKSLERALACKVNDEIFVIVTRGEKATGGYAVHIDKVEQIKEAEEEKMIVYTTFKDPSVGDVVTQVSTYPHVVAKTNLKELPDKIELKVKYDD